jgi:hypothetical protein
MTQLQYEKILKSDNDKLKYETMIYIKNRKYNWNKGYIKLSTKAINEIISFQCALNKIMPGSVLEKDYLGR